MVWGWGGGVGSVDGVGGAGGSGADVCGGGGHGGAGGGAGGGDGGACGGANESTKASCVCCMRSVLNIHRHLGSLLLLPGRRFRLFFHLFPADIRSISVHNTSPTESGQYISVALY